MPVTPAGVSIRPFAPSDSFRQLTGLLHRAHAAHVARGLRLQESHQDDEVTRRRASEGECLLAFIDTTLVGTVTALPGGRQSECFWYRRPDTAGMAQLAVEPCFQGRGIGRALMDAAERRVAEWGATRIAVDTAEQAAELIATYRRRGYSAVDSISWSFTSYRSVVLVKSLPPALGKPSARGVSGGNT